MDLKYFLAFESMFVVSVVAMIAVARATNESVIPITLTTFACVCMVYLNLSRVK